MIDIRNPAWWMSLAGVIGAAVGLFSPGLAEPVRAACVAVGGVVIAVYTHGQHSVAVAQTHAAAHVAAAKTAAVAAAANPQSPPPVAATVAAPDLLVPSP